MPKRRGPSSETSDMWIRFLTSANGSRSCELPEWGGVAAERRSCRSMDLPTSPEERPPGCRRLRRWLCDRQDVRRSVLGEILVCKLRQRLRGAGILLRDDDGESVGDRPRNRAVARDEDIRAPPENPLHVLLADSDAGVGSVQDELHARRLVPHQRERLET